MSRLADQLKEAVQAFAGCRTPPALIGGLALAAHSVVRATQNVDFLVDRDDAEFVHSVLTGLGYQCVHRSEDAANYVRGDQGLDLLYAHRPVARRLLADAEVRATTMGQVHVISSEGLIGLELQALSNDLPKSRTTPPDKVREPLAGDGGVGFRPVARTDLSDWVELMEVVEALCPVWPARRRAMVGEFRL